MILIHARHLKNTCFLELLLVVFCVLCVMCCVLCVVCYVLCVPDPLLLVVCACCVFHFCLLCYVLCVRVHSFASQSLCGLACSSVGECKHCLLFSARSSERGIKCFLKQPLDENATDDDCSESDKTDAAQKVKTRMYTNSRLSDTFLQNIRYT